MTVRNMSAQPHEIFIAYRSFEVATAKNFNGISLDLSSPKAEVRGSNPFGRANCVQNHEHLWLVSADLRLRPRGWLCRR
jgi:hypothetical protein